MRRPVAARGLGIPRGVSRGDSNRVQAACYNKALIMLPSAFTRFWNTVNPPPSRNWPAPPKPSEKVLEMRRRQRRLITITFAAVAAMGAGAWAYTYIASAPERADMEFQEGMKFMGPG